MSAGMNALWAPFLAVAAVFVVVAGAAAWWHQRRTVAELQRRLHEAEGSRRELADHMASLRQRLDAARVKAAVGDDIAERKLALERALDQAGSAAPEFPWLETMPAAEPGEGTGFEPTRPDHLRTAGPRVDVNLEDAGAAR